MKGVVVKFVVVPTLKTQPQFYKAHCSIHHEVFLEKIEKELRLESHGIISLVQYSD